MTSPSRVGSHSPASPRLPSPPPFPEVQIGRRSPSPSSAHSDSLPTPEDHPSEDYGAARRIRPGTKAADMASGPPLVPLAELDSAFQLQEHLKSLYLAATTSPSSPDLTQPITRASATSLATPPQGIDRSLWLYELCRFLVQRANTLIVGFFADNPPCSAVNCPEMRASEWQYLCAVHDPPKSCCAIDYCCHTLDWAAGVLTSQRHFPSRLTLGPGGKEGGLAGSQSGDAASVRQLTNIFRRVYRMFAHAWFQHRDVFWTIENQEGLYVFYKTVCDVYSLIPEDNYTIPPEAEGLNENDKKAEDGEWTREPLHGTGSKLVADSEVGKSSRPSSLDFGRSGSSSKSDDYPTKSNESQTTLSTGATTRRHKQTPSTGSFVTTIHEGDEDSQSPAPSAAPGSSYFNQSTTSTTTSSSDSTKTQTQTVDTKADTKIKPPKTARRIGESGENETNDSASLPNPIEDTSAPEPSANSLEPQTVASTSTSDKVDAGKSDKPVSPTPEIVIKSEDDNVTSDSTAAAATGSGEDAKDDTTAPAADAAIVTEDKKADDNEAATKDKDQEDETKEKVNTKDEVAEENKKEDEKSDEK